jgi:hypothetical protein
MKVVPFYMQEDMDVMCNCPRNMLGMLGCRVKYQRFRAKVTVRG